MAQTQGALPYMTGRVFVDAAFSPQQLDAAQDMIAEIKAAFKRNLGGLEWMDDATKRLARQTLPTPQPSLTRAAATQKALPRDVIWAPRPSSG